MSDQPIRDAGAALCALYPTSRDLADLVEPFQGSVRRFIGGLQAQGCEVEIHATYRPPERAYLMRCAWDVGYGLVEPDAVSPPAPPLQVIPIRWTKAGALAMVAEYGLAYRPAGTLSLHCLRRAIDMTITGWKAGDPALWKYGAGFGVHKLEKDKPHWSDTGG